MAEFVDESPDSVRRACCAICLVCSSANFVGAGVTLDGWTVAHSFSDGTSVGPNGFNDSGTGSSHTGINHIDKVNVAVLVVIVLRKVDAVPPQDSVQCFNQGRPCHVVSSVTLSSPVICTRSGDGDRADNVECRAECSRRIFDKVISSAALVVEFVIAFLVQHFRKLFFRVCILEFDIGKLDENYDSTDVA